MAVFVRTRFFLQRAFIWIGWAICIFLMARWTWLEFIDYPANASFLFTATRAGALVMVAHGAAWIVRVGLYD